MQKMFDIDLQFTYTLNIKIFVSLADFIVCPNMSVGVRGSMFSSILELEYSIIWS